MWSELDFESMAAEEHGQAGSRSKREVVQILIMVRLELYNRQLPCGPSALRRWLQKHYSFMPPLSERTIARILARNGLTHARTGCYEADPNRHQRYPGKSED